MYEVKNPFQSAMNGMNQASGTTRGMMPNIPGPEKPDPTVGGGMMAGMGGSMAGAQIGTMVATGSTAGPVGAGIGAVVGIGAYLLS